MPIAFSRSVRSLEVDGHRRSYVTLAITSGLVALWAAWFLTARVAVVEVTETARLEVDQAAHSVESPVAGRVTAVHLQLGKPIERGDVLIELDDSALQLARNEERARQASLAAQVAAVRAEIATEEHAMASRRQVAQSKILEARNRQREALTAADFSEGEARRSERLFEGGLASEADRTRAKTEADRSRANAAGAELAIARTESEERAAEAEQRAKLARLGGEVATFEGQQAMSAATLARLDHDIDLRRVRAPVSGRLGDVAALRVGGVVREGDKLGAIIPTGDVRIVAEYAPASAVGRIRPGQTARMRPEGFPWTQYGSLKATVSRVASEPRSGRIRVELDVTRDPASEIPLQHGLPGAVEIEVDRVSPAVLVLRTSGSRFEARQEVRNSGSARSEETPPRP